MCEKKNQLWNVFGFGFVFLGSRKISENIIGWSPTTELYEIHGWNEWNSEKNWSNLSKHKLCISSISNLIAWRFERIFPRKYALLENINLLPQKYSEWSSTRNEIMYSYIYISRWVSLWEWQRTLYKMSAHNFIHQHSHMPKLRIPRLVQFFPFSH